MSHVFQEDSEALSHHICCVYCGLDVNSLTSYCPAAPVAVGDSKASVDEKSASKYEERLDFKNPHTVLHRERDTVTGEFIDRWTCLNCGHSGSSSQMVDDMSVDFIECSCTNLA